MHRRTVADERKRTVFVCRTSKSLPRTFKERRERHRSGARGLDPHDKDIVGERREHLPREGHAVHTVLCAHHGILKGKGPAIARREVVPRKLKAERADRLVGEGVAVLRSLETRFPERVQRAIGIPRQDACPDLGDLLFHPRFNRIVWAARPQRILVELDPLQTRRAIDHRAETPVADRQRLVPCAGGGIIVERKPRRRRRNHQSKDHRQGPYSRPIDRNPACLSPDGESVPECRY